MGYKFITKSRTVSNTYAQVTSAQLCANHEQHIGRTLGLVLGACGGKKRRASHSTTHKRDEGNGKGEGGGGGGGGGEVGEGCSMITKEVELVSCQCLTSVRSPQGEPEMKERQDGMARTLVLFSFFYIVSHMGNGPLGLGHKQQGPQLWGHAISRRHSYKITALFVNTSGYLSIS